MADELRVNIDNRIFSANADGNLFVSREGMYEWWDSPETRTPDDPLPQSHGSQTPASILLGARRFTFQGWAESSTPEEAETDFRVWAAGLALKPMFLVGVYHAGRWMWMRNASVRGKVKIKPHRNDLRRTDIEMVLWSPDAFKYTSEVTRTIAAGSFTISNTSTGPIYPWYEVEGSKLTITTSRGEGITLNAPSASGTTRISPYVGGRAVQTRGSSEVDLTLWLERAQWPVIHPGETVTFTTDRSVTVRHYGGAYL